ncbi:carboxypeptidase-like regulatory domain-containing protein [Psychroserpens burtonensis]|uniref:Carboxypeptidase-like regulatory domain-containing protein n=1 Tax=Psychroserpens burtonensis TaxID=49278 RepID=A0A5C7BH96_9FLAO|nr:carboxypeptidase-like regulatory domain-containing protein [Psychroserpens burtonensis]TXE18132.1 carboxypeptidase-like regulatory domain-containing protein [Psychroserpens burtonensis]
MEIQRIKILQFFLILSAIHIHAQSISGIILDAKTNLPIESASVYFDNTTIGTSTNYQGKFEIEKSENISSNLVISFIGYEKVTIKDYDTNSIYKFY